MPFEIFDSSDDDRAEGPFADGAPADRDAELLVDEANWPEEFSMLASQLSADAARLAAIYPARPDSTDVVHESAEPAAIAVEQTAGVVLHWFASARGARWIAAAAILALASLATLSAYPSADPAAIAEQNVQPAVQVAVNGAANASAPQEAALLFEETGFENLSLPAQEALLDLFEDNQLAQTSLSI
ncbi:MAG TPA: hypothetical protein VGJ26_01385 [Pirellulales bacterium]|jgi:hypothetical protein